jgi:hypothetical protein
MKKKIECLLVFFCCCGMCYAQQLVSAAGYSVKSDVSVNWILGGNISGLSANQKLFNYSQEVPLMDSEISLKVYPVPTSDFINIETTPVDTGRLNLELYDSRGVKVLNKTVAFQPILQVDISNFPSGIYFLKVVIPQKDQLFKTEKIIKK